jgi:hypothetical protein
MSAKPPSKLIRMEKQTVLKVEGGKNPVYRGTKTTRNGYSKMTL